MNIASFKEYEIQHYKTSLTQIPAHAIIYFICDDNGEIIYIGRTLDIGRRISQHQRRVEFIGTEVFFFCCPLNKCEQEEARLIREIKPKCNYHIPGIVRHEIPELAKFSSLIAAHDLKVLRKEIIRIIKEKKITLGTVASATRLHRQTVHNLLNIHGSTNIKSMVKIIKICVYLNINYKNEKFGLRKIIKESVH